MFSGVVNFHAECCLYKLDQQQQHVDFFVISFSICFCFIRSLIFPIFPWLLRFSWSLEHHQDHPHWSFILRFFIFMAQNFDLLRVDWWQPFGLRSAWFWMILLTAVSSCLILMLNRWNFHLSWCFLFFSPFVCLF